MALKPRLIKEFAEFECGLLIVLRECEFSYCGIADIVSRNVTNVNDCCQQWSREGTASRRPSSGQTRDTTEKEDRFAQHKWLIVMRQQQKFEGIYEGMPYLRLSEKLKKS